MNDDLDIKVAMETAVSAADDLTTIASGDLVPIYRPNPQTGRDELVGKIPKSYFDQSVQASLKDLLRGTDLGTNIDKVPALNSGSFGSSTIADLASVLGGYHGNISYTQQDSVTENGVYDVSGINSANVLTDDGVLIVTQHYRTKIGTSVPHYAVKVSNGNWSIFPEFYKNYNSLSALSNALGIHFQFGDSYDADIFEDGFYVYATNSPQSVQNIPVSTGIILLFTFVGLNGIRGIQLLLCGSILYTRTLSDTWGSWSQIE